MKLAEIFAILGNRSGGISDLSINGIQSDSRKVKPGDVFVAVNGNVVDGHQYIAEAIEQGAAAVIGQQSLSRRLAIPYIKVDNSREALGKLVSHFYHYPSKKHIMIGITGTNGKTTTSYLIKHIIEKTGRTCGLIGTVENVINEQSFSPSNTTPDAVLLQKLLHESRDEFIILEISSHALNQSRTEGLELDFALFTNLSHDHLDYHHNMENYFSEKKKIFQLLKTTGEAVINYDNEWGKVLSGELTAIPFTLFGKDTEFEIKDIALKGQTSFTIHHNGEAFSIQLPLQGIHNVYNASMAFVTAYKMGIPPHNISAAFRSFSGVPGRFETFYNDKGARFVIDYAHTKDAFEYCLQTAKYQHAKNIYHIFGFRGGRDHTKRKEMVAASAKYSDGIILTLDDLNGEAKEDVITELKKHRASFPQSQVIPDRTIAIQTLWEAAREGDWVFITGKGPEEYKDDYQLGTSGDLDTLKFLKRKKGGT
ncbi:UDP-N-acetylmuramoyl-L-alanyl-D-glutamate--2,6-diaminopimelate ligase [Bacillus sp. CRN 9]|nr:UDP-N-acetylmuramoyl-L-alanyl-D-glutamate--2,6-diaminopimelate ligase [Bacillus sp. CRN 9]